MPVSIRFLGTAAFEILTAENKRILIDPYLDENSKSPYKVRDLDSLDLLLVTHAAYDHLGDSEQPLRRFSDPSPSADRPYLKPRPTPRRHASNG